MKKSILRIMGCICILFSLGMIAIINKSTEKEIIIFCLVISALGAIFFFVASTNKFYPIFCDKINNAKPRGGYVQLGKASNQSKTDYFTFKVAGTTFKNGQQSRQTILRRIKWRDEPFDKPTINWSIEEYDYEGETAFGIYADGNQIGNVPRENINEVSALWERITKVHNVEITGGGTSQSGEQLSCGAKVTLTLKPMINNNVSRTVTSPSNNTSANFATVWASKNSKAYHINPACPYNISKTGSKLISRKEANKRGLKPCKKCSL